MASSITWKTRTFIALSSKRAIRNAPARSLCRWRIGEGERTISRSTSSRGAPRPVRAAEKVVALTGSYCLYDFGIRGTGRLRGNRTELTSQSFGLFVFDDAGYASFRDGSNTVAPVFRRSGTSIVFNVNLTGSGQYHVVAVDVPQRRELQIHLDLVVVGLKTGETIVALIVLVGGLALVGATLMLSVWSWRRTRSAPAPAPAPDPASDPFPDPPLDPLPDPLPEPQEAAQDPPDDNTRIY